VNCASSKLVKSADGKISPLTSTCNCFVRGFSEGIEIPGKTDVQFSCTYSCVADLLKHTSDFVLKANGPSGTSLSCSSELDKIAAGEYGNRNGYVATQTETDPLEVMPVDDAKVTRAADALRISINSARRANCPATRPYDDAGRVVYARRGIVADGKGQYRLEVVFGNDVVHARIAHLAAEKQIVDPAGMAALDDPDNLEGRFEIMSIVPAPCENGVPQQLAVSATGDPFPPNRLPTPLRTHPPARTHPVVRTQGRRRSTGSGCRGSPPSAPSTRASAWRTSASATSRSRRRSARPSTWSST
jgi:hypothetical protein